KARGSAGAAPRSWRVVLMQGSGAGRRFAWARSPLSLVFMLGCPSMMLLTWVMQRRAVRRDFARETAIWREDVRAVLATLDTAATHQRAHAEEDEPDLDVVLSRAVARDHRLWVRR